MMTSRGLPARSIAAAAAQATSTPPAPAPTTTIRTGAPPPPVTNASSRCEPRRAVERLDALRVGRGGGVGADEPILDRYIDDPGRRTGGKDAAGQAGPGGISHLVRVVTEIL